MLVRARELKTKLLQSGEASLNETSRSAGISRWYLTRLARLAFLAPDIVCAILDGRQPAQLTAARLSRITHLPLDWSEQRKMVGPPDKTNLWHSRCRAIARSPRRFTASSPSSTRSATFAPRYTRKPEWRRAARIHRISATSRSLVSQRRRIGLKSRRTPRHSLRLAG